MHFFNLAFLRHLCFTFLFLDNFATSQKNFFFLYIYFFLQKGILLHNAGTKTVTTGIYLNIYYQNAPKFQKK